MTSQLLLHQYTCSYTNCVQTHSHTDTHSTWCQLLCLSAPSLSTQLLFHSAVIVSMNCDVSASGGVDVRHN